LSAAERGSKRIANNDVKFEKNDVLHVIVGERVILANHLAHSAVYFGPP
jgi:hypothetical protein